MQRSPNKPVWSPLQSALPSAFPGDGEPVHGACSVGLRRRPIDGGEHTRAASLHEQARVEVHQIVRPAEVDLSSRNPSGSTPSAESECGEHKSNNMDLLGCMPNTTHDNKADIPALMRLCTELEQVSKCRQLSATPPTRRNGSRMKRRRSDNMDAKVTRCRRARVAGMERNAYTIGMVH